MDSLNCRIIAFALLLFTACNSTSEHENSQDKTPSDPKNITQTDILDHYLRMTFDDTVSHGNSFLIFLPSASCKGCNKRGIDQLITDLPDSIAERCTIITVDSNLVPKTLSNRVTTLVDQERIMDNVRLPIANLTVVHLVVGKVVAIKSAKATDTVGVMELFAI